MEEKKIDLFVIWHKYGQHITAISVLFLLIFSAYQITVHNSLQEEIKNECGWEEDEDYYCVCEKSLAQTLRTKLENPVPPTLPSILNVTLDN